MSVTTIVVGCMCQQHEKTCGRRRRKGRRFCSDCIEYCR